MPRRHQQRLRLLHLERVLTAECSYPVGQAPRQRAGNISDLSRCNLRVFKINLSVTVQIADQYPERTECVTSRVGCQAESRPSGLRAGRS